jgi:hypothetical protein
MRLLAICVTVMVGGHVLGTAFAQDSISQDKDLSPNQRKLLRQFQADLEKRPMNPNASDQYVERVQTTLKTLFSVNNQPSAQCTDILGSTLYRGLVNGQIPAQTSVSLAREISKVLGATEINYRTVNDFTRRIDPLVRQTTLGPTEQLKLYREAIIILKTVPNYVPEAP